jgi:hypothetical protein
VKRHPRKIRPQIPAPWKGARCSATLVCFCDPSRVVEFCHPCSGGIVAALLNPRLISGNPPGCNTRRCVCALATILFSDLLPSHHEKPHLPCTNLFLP